MTAGPRILLATDLDGTLLRSDGTISARTRAALAEAAASGEVDVVFVTGRPPTFLTEIAGETGHTGTIISGNGALVLDATTLAARRVHAFDADVALGLLSSMARDGVPISSAGDRARVQREAPRAGGNAEVESYEGDLRVPVELRAMMLDSDGQGHREVGRDAAFVAHIADRLAAGWRLFKMAVVGPDNVGPEAFVAAVRRLVGDVAEVSHSWPTWVLAELGPAGVSKGSALAQHAIDIGVDAAEVHAIGDMLNDLPMLEVAGRSYAVANAHPQVRSRVDRVLPANDHDGVAHLLEELLRR